MELERLRSAADHLVYASECLRSVSDPGRYDMQRPRSASDHAPLAPERAATNRNGCAACLTTRTTSLNEKRPAICSPAF